MTFDSLKFLFFFLVFILSLKVSSSKIKPLLVLIASYYFYSVLNPLFLPIILLSTITDYFCAIYIEKKSQLKNWFLATSLTVNLGLLFTFKYYHFFAENILEITKLIGFPIQLPLFSFLFPIGISFYTLQTIGYTIEVWRGEARAERSYITFSNFVCFFPQLIAGPLEKSNDLIPQLRNLSWPTRVDLKWYVTLIMMGLYKKVVISDRLAVIIEQNTQNPQELLYSAKNLLTYYLMFFRLYYDFSGYSIMAVGIAGVIGVRLSHNFHFPQFASNFSDFWRNWHITLHIWLKDNLFKPILRSHPKKKLTAVILVFLVSGLWHGASWNFIIWGLFNAIGVLFYQKFLKNRIAKSFLKNSWSFKLASIFITHFLISVTSSFYFFKSFSDAISFIKNGFYFSRFHLGSYVDSLSLRSLLDLKLTLSFLILTEIISFIIFIRKPDIQDFAKKNFYLINILLFIAVFIFANQVSTDFRYYNF